MKIFLLIAATALFHLGVRVLMLVSVVMLIKLVIVHLVMFVWLMECQNMKEE
jgi:hypothetical protein